MQAVYSHSRFGFRRSLHVMSVQVITIELWSCHTLLVFFVLIHDSKHWLHILSIYLFFLILSFCFIHIINIEEGRCEVTLPLSKALEWPKSISIYMLPKSEGTKKEGQDRTQGHKVESNTLLTDHKYIEQQSCEHQIQCGCSIFFNLPTLGKYISYKIAMLSLGNLKIPH